MPASADVTRWLHLLKSNEQQAIQKLWEVYYRPLLALARNKLGGLQRAVRDEEDIALSAFDSFCRGVAHGRFQRLDDRQDLWQVLVLVTTRKAIDQIAHEHQACRDQDRTTGQTDRDLDDRSLLDDLISREPDPGFAAEVADQCRQLLADLPDEQLRRIVLSRMEGYSNEEIAVELKVSVPTVERRLNLIRKTWKAAGRQEQAGLEEKS
jgi:RNA polymerase sigma factor (sigma-70 family)